MHSKRLVTASVIATVLVLAACSNAVNGSGNQSTDSSSPTGSAPATGSSFPSTSPSDTSSDTGSPAGFPADVDSLGALLAKGNSSISSAHLELKEDAGGVSIVGTGDEKLSDGKVVAMDLTEEVSGSTLRFVIVDDKVYAKLPAAMHQSSKPWVQISPTTSDAQLRALYDSFKNATQTGAGDTVRVFVAAAKNLRLVGTEQFDGTVVAHYALAVDIASLPSDFPNRDALEASGLTSIPIELYVDPQGRTRKVTESFTVSGQHVSVLVTLTRIDTPVDIVAPPSSEVEPA